MSKKTQTKEKVYKNFDSMVKGHGVLSYQEILALNEPSIKRFLECDGETDDAEGYIFACMDSGRALVDILERHNLHVITLSIYDCDDEEELDEENEDEDRECKMLYSYATGFHVVNRERYYLCRKKTPAICEEEV